MKKPATAKTTTNNKQIITINTNNDNKNKNKNKNKSNSSSSGSKTTTACCSKMGLKRGPWTAEEDKVLSDFIRREGEGHWRTLPNRAGLSRCGKSCRLRWMNYLRPSIKRGRIAPDEEDLILRLHRLLGNRWSLIAGRIPGRTDNEIKNYWNTHLSKKLISQGIDPRTHKPLVIKPNDHQTNNKNIPSSSSSSKTNHLMFPKNPNNDNFQTSTVGEDQTYNKENSYLQVDHVDLGGPYQTTGEVANFQCYENLPSSDGFDVGLRRSTSPNLVPGNYEEDNINVDDLNCSVDDVLSSFLNSLINEEAFSGAPNGIAPLSTDAFGVPENNASDGWESAVTSCTNDLQREVDDRVE